MLNIVYAVALVTVAVCGLVIVTKNARDEERETLAMRAVLELEVLAFVDAREEEAPGFASEARELHSVLTYTRWNTEMRKRTLAADLPDEMRSGLLSRLAALELT